MLESGIIALRLLQYLGAMVLLGSSLFFIYALPRSGAGSAVHLPWMRNILVGAALLLALASMLYIAAQSALLSGSVAEGLKPESLTAVVTYMALGKAAVVRTAAALAAVFSLAFLRGRARFIVAACFGAVATVSLAWMGHAAATEGWLGWVHLFSDVLHVLAAAIWIGALTGFLGLLLAGLKTPKVRANVHAALAGFAGIGSAMVAILILTGLVNSWVLVGPANLESLWNTEYGRLLSLKLLAFLAMLGLAAANRYRLTPALGRSLGASAEAGAQGAALRRSIALETALGIAVLLLVAWFGTLAPPAAG